MRLAPKDAFDSIELSDFQAATELLRRSWIENKETPLDYSPSFIRSFLCSGGSESGYTAALSRDGELVAFVLAAPRTVLLRGEPRKLGLMTLFTVASGFKGQGLGLRVWEECLKKLQTAGFDGAIYYCAQGNRSNFVTSAAAARAGFVAEKVKEIAHLARPIIMDAKDSASETPGVEGELLVELSSRLSADLRRQYSLEEARRFLGRDDVVSQGYREGSAVGVLAGYVLPVQDRERSSCLLLDEVLWGDLSDTGRAKLLQNFLRRARARASFVVVPQLGYANLSPLKAARFRLSPQVLNAYITLFDHSPVPALESMYIDVL